MIHWLSFRATFPSDSNLASLVSWLHESEGWPGGVRVITRYWEAGWLLQLMILFPRCRATITIHSTLPSMLYINIWAPFSQYGDVPQWTYYEAVAAHHNKKCPSLKHTGWGNIFLPFNNMPTVYSMQANRTRTHTCMMTNTDARESRDSAWLKPPGLHLPLSL